MDAVKKLMKQSAKKAADTPTEEPHAKSSGSLAEGNSRRSFVCPDKLWEDIGRVCERLPFTPSIAKFIVATLQEAVDEQKKELGITD